MGRPFKCDCGSTNNVSKGVRRTKTMGIRRIRLCKDCGRKFTPKSQKPKEPGEETDSEQQAVAAPENANTQGSAELPAPAAPEPSVRNEPTGEVVDHPRY